MNQSFLFAVLTSLIIIAAGEISAQQKKIQAERGTVHTVSGIGLGLTIGSTGEVIKPKVSTKVGVDISIGTKNAFLYPSVNFLVYSFDQKVTDPEYTYSIANGGRSTVTSFTIPVGLRQAVGKINTYGFIGPGASLIREPRTEVDDQNQQVSIREKDTYSISLTTGVGIEYILGRFALFAEASYLYNFKDLQDRKAHIIPVYVGFKSDISSVFRARAK